MWLTRKFASLPMAQDISDYESAEHFGFDSKYWTQLEWEIYHSIRGNILLEVLITEHEIP